MLALSNDESKTILRINMNKTYIQIINYEQMNI